MLISWGILKEEGGEVYPTNAYALLTGRMWGQPVIQCGVFKGTNRAHFVDRREFEGSIQEQMEAAYQYVLEKINMGMIIKGMYRQDVYELPTDSIRELIANAVAHRSYLEPGNIQVALFDDRLEITSPGMLLNNVTIAKMMEGYSRPRNPAIASAFAYMKIIEKWGTGIPRLFEACEEYGLPKPELIDVVVTSGCCDRKRMLNQIALLFCVVKMPCSTAYDTINSVKELNETMQNVQASSEELLKMAEELHKIMGSFQL